MKSTELYVSTDIEANGPIPGRNSLLSFASAIYRPDGSLVDTFAQNLHLLSDSEPDPATMEWWSKRPAEYQACRESLADPEAAMREYAGWLDSHKGKLVFVGYPASYDFMFVYWYLMRFVGRSPFGFAALDIKSYAMAVLGTTFKGTSKRKMPKEWFAEVPKHTHVALDDAIEQGKLFCNILAHAQERRTVSP
jgi:hypothetical protein